MHSRNIPPVKKFFPRRVNLLLSPALVYFFSSLQSFNRFFPLFFLLLLIDLGFLSFVFSSHSGFLFNISVCHIFRFSSIQHDFCHHPSLPSSPPPLPSPPCHLSSLTFHPLPAHPRLLFIYIFLHSAFHLYLFTLSDSPLCLPLPPPDTRIFLLCLLLTSSVLFLLPSLHFFLLPYFIPLLIFSIHPSISVYPFTQRKRTCCQSSLAGSQRRHNSPSTPFSILLCPSYSISFSTILNSFVYPFCRFPAFKQPHINLSLFSFVWWSELAQKFKESSKSGMMDRGEWVKKG